MAEKLTLQKTFWKGGTACGNEGFVPPLTLMMNSPGNDFLACTGFSNNEHGGRRRGYGFNQFKYLEHLRAFGDNPLEAVPVLNLPPQRDVFLDEVMMVHQVFYEKLNFFRTEWLFDIIISAFSYGGYGCLNCAVSRYDDS